jgi:hypothetical protein
MSSPAMSNYLAQKILNQLFRSTAFTFPTTMWVALCTVTPVASDTGTSIAIGATAGTGVEVTGTSYARVSYNPGTGNWSAASGSGAETTTNSNALTFPTAGGTWGTITGGAIVDNTVTVYSGKTFTNGSPTVNLASTTGLFVGDPVWLTDGTNTLSTSILSMVANTSVTLAANWTAATATGTGTLTDGGDMLFYFALSSSKTVGSGDIFQFSAANLSVEIQ